MRRIMVQCAHLMFSSVQGQCKDGGCAVTTSNPTVVPGIVKDAASNQIHYPLTTLNLAAAVTEALRWLAASILDSVTELLRVH